MMIVYDNEVLDGTEVQGGQTKIVEAPLVSDFPSIFLYFPLFSSISPPSSLYFPPFPSVSSYLNSVLLS